MPTVLTSARICWGWATPPLGIRAASRMAAGCGGTADDELCRFVVLNTASIQLLPTTVAALRSADIRAPISGIVQRRPFGQGAGVSALICWRMPGASG